MGLIRSLEELHPAFLPIASAWLNDCRMAGLDLIVTETRRTSEVQAAYYAYGREKYVDVCALYLKAGLRIPDSSGYSIGPGHWKTKAKPGFSWHLYGLAIDFAPMVNGEIDWLYTPSEESDHWDEISSLAKKRGMTWGGDFKDRVMPDGSVRSFKDRPHVEYHPGYTSVQQAFDAMQLAGGDWRVPVPRIAQAA